MDAKKLDRISNESQDEIISTIGLMVAEGRACVAKLSPEEISIVTDFAMDFGMLLASKGVKAYAFGGDVTEALAPALKKLKDSEFAMRLLTTVMGSFRG